MIRAILHLLNDQPLLVDLLAMPTQSDIAVICTNLHTVDGKKPVFIDYPSSTFVFPMVFIRFLEIVPAPGEGQLGPATVATAAEPEELEIDEEFLRRVREA